MTEASEWERWEALVTPILEASPSLSEPEIGGLTEQIVDGIMQRIWPTDQERIARLERHIAAARKMLRVECAVLGDNDWPDDLHLADVIQKHLGRPARREIEELKDWRRFAWALLTAVASSGVEHDDSRMDYLTVQIDRGTWDTLEPYRLRPNQFMGDDEDAAEAMASVRRGELPDDAGAVGWEQEAQVQDERAQWAEEVRDEARAEVERLKAENAALTASLRAANATTRAAQSRADRAEAALRQRNEP